MNQPNTTSRAAGTDAGSLANHGAAAVNHGAADANQGAAATATTQGYLDTADKTFNDCRQRLIAYLVKLNHALDRNLSDLSHALLQRFCESLVDYLSAGHFNVFQRVALAADEYAAIESTTEDAMRFNDRFGGIMEIDVADVKVALEQIALVLGVRFEIEDDIIHADGSQLH